MYYLLESYVLKREFLDIDDISNQEQFETYVRASLNNNAGVSEQGIDLMISMLSLDPHTRPTATKLLQNPWFD